MTGSFRSLLTLACILVAGVATAQPAPSRVELAVQVSTLRLSDFDATNAGIGGRVTVNLAPWAAVESEAAYYPDDEVRVPAATVLPSLRVAYERKRAEAFFGIKLGVSGRRFGVFGKLRPGFTRLSHQGVLCVGDDCALVQMLLAVPEYRTEFALDAGGGVEFYPSQRTVARFDLGDTIIRHRSSAPPCYTGCTSHNVATRVGFGMRF